MVSLSFPLNFNAQTGTATMHLTAICSLYVCQGWDAYGYGCYWMEETVRSWSDAKAFCKEQDAFLVHIGDM